MSKKYNQRIENKKLWAKRNEQHVEYYEQRAKSRKIASDKRK